MSIYLSRRHSNSITKGVGYRYQLGTHVGIQLVLERWKNPSDLSLARRTTPASCEEILWHVTSLFTAKAGSSVDQRETSWSADRPPQGFGSKQDSTFTTLVAHPCFLLVFLLVGTSVEEWLILRHLHTQRCYARSVHLMVAGQKSLIHACGHSKQNALEAADTRFGDPDRNANADPYESKCI